MNLTQTYRPEDFDQVYGQEAMVRSLRKIIERKAAHAYLFYGDSGLGKTTLARIAARALDCYVKEIPAAVVTGIENVREVLMDVHYSSLIGKQANKGIIFDECHRLSGNAWDSLLKVLEESPPHVYWFLCTTLLHKVPKTIQTRCQKFQLKPLDNDTLTDLIAAVCEAEGIDLPAEVRQLVVKEANGSPRLALSHLEACRDVRSRKEAAELVSAVIADSEPILALCRLVANGNATWGEAMKQVGKLNGESPEGVRIAIINYLGAALKGARNDKDACYFLSKMDAFSTSYGGTDAEAQLLRSLGQCLFAD